MKKLIMGVLVAIGFTAQAQKPAVVADNEPGWKHIGQVTASFKTTSESIIVLGADEFQAIKLKVLEAPIQIDRVQVFYESGQMEELDVKSQLKEGAETRVINLSNPKRDIKKVAFTYKTLPNSSGDKADVELYGLKTSAQGDDAYIKDDVNDAKREAKEEAREVREEAREDAREIKRDAREEASEVEKDVNEDVNIEKEAEEAGDAISEAAAKAAAAITDQKLDNKVGPNGQTVYVDEHAKYYYINKEGKKVFITRLQLKDKPNND